MVSHAANLPPTVALVQQLVWDDLKMFLALAQSGSTRQAAEMLGVNASTVSRKVAALEETLGSRLVQRHPDGLRLTQAGKDVVDVALQMNESVRAMARRVAGADRKLVGTVRVSVPEIIAASVSETLFALLEQHRELQVDFRVDDGIVDLSRHEVDVVVRVSDTPPEDLVGRKLGRANVGVYATERYWSRNAFDMHDERHRWIEWPSYMQRKAACVWLNREVPLRRVAVFAGSSQAVFAAASGGVGLALVPHVYARRHAGLVSRWSLPDVCGTDVWALTNKDISRTARVRVVLSALTRLAL
jgi:DNA-binding transcriptional LysR family regulator